MKIVSPGKGKRSERASDGGARPIHLRDCLGPSFPEFSSVAPVMFGAIFRLRSTAITVGMPFIYKYQKPRGEPEKRRNPGYQISININVHPSGNLILSPHTIGRPRS